MVKKTLEIRIAIKFHWDRITISGMQVFVPFECKDNSHCFCGMKYWKNWQPIKKICTLTEVVKRITKVFLIEITTFLVRQPSFLKIKFST